MVRSLETEQGSLQYEIIQETAVITGYSGRDIGVVIPDQIEGVPVVWIGKKAFLSNKTVREVILPKGIVGIGDWAFACCSHLESVTLPYRRMEMGQGVFKDCGQLVRVEDDIGYAGQEKRREDTAWLLAASVNQLDAFYLFDLENAGTESWLAGWDTKVKNLMALEDSDGFSKMLLCGEEDYGSKDNDLGYYMEQKRRGKVRLAMLRLMHDYGLGEELRESLLAYLLAHIKGCETEETWQVVLEEHGDDRLYYEFLTKIGGVTEDNFQQMIEDMGEHHTEMKAYLMRYHEKIRDSRDAFAQFAL